MDAYKCSRCGEGIYLVPDEQGKRVALSYVYPWKRRLQKSGEYVWVQEPKKSGKGVMILHAGACQPARVTRAS
jgi:hypothetical protein